VENVGGDQRFIIAIFQVSGASPCGDDLDLGVRALLSLQNLLKFSVQISRRSTRIDP
jgi:hypothetical protein